MEALADALDGMTDDRAHGRLMAAKADATRTASNPSTGTLPGSIEVFEKVARIAGPDRARRGPLPDGPA